MDVRWDHTDGRWNCDWEKNWGLCWLSGCCPFGFGVVLMMSRRLWELGYAGIVGLVGDELRETDLTVFSGIFSSWLCVCFISWFIIRCNEGRGW